MKIEIKYASASEFGLPLPIDTKGVVMAIYNKGRLLALYNSRGEAWAGLEILQTLMADIDKEIANGC